MLILKLILLGSISGITEFFPVSSTGHVSLIGNLLGVDIDLFLLTIFHLGSLFSIILYFRNVLIKCLRELIYFIQDSAYNLSKFLFKGDLESVENNYRKLFINNYRRLSFMILVASAPCVIIGSALAPIIENISGNVLSSATGFFATALILLIASYAVKNSKGVKETKISDSIIIGIFQSVSVFPGVSRYAMVYSAGLFRSFSKKLSKLFAFVLSVPIIIGAFFFEGYSSSWQLSTIGILPAIFGLFSAMIVSFFVIHFAIKAIRIVPLKLFSIYCFCLGTVCVLVYLS